VSDLFKCVLPLGDDADRRSRMVRTCHEKCVGQRYHEPTLNKGESVCVDRCVGSRRSLG